MPLGAAKAALFGAAGGGAAIRAGYFGGGRVSGWAPVATMQKILFSDDTISVLGTGLSIARSAPAGVADSLVAGYMAGGNTPSGFSTSVDKFLLADDTRTTISSILAQARKQMAGFSNSGTAGYWAGGQD